MVEELRVGVVMILLLAYLCSAYVYAAQHARDSWRDLAPALRCSPAEREGFAASAGRYPRQSLRLAGLTGLAAGLLLQALVDQNLSEAFVLSALPQETLLLRCVTIGVAWWGGRFVFAARAESLRLSRAGRELLEIDLLDASATAPLVRHGLRSALLAVGLLTLVSLLLYDREAAPGFATALVVLLSLTLLLAASLLLLPLRGARDAIARAKRDELAWCNAEIRRLRDAVTQSERAGGGSERGGLADLIAYKRHVAEVREWPIDNPTLRRFALTLVLPLGGWLGGALVERVVDRLLD